MGPVHPVREASYALLRRLFTEVSALFPDEYLHVGGDETGTNCWCALPFSHVCSLAFTCVCVRTTLCEAERNN